MADVSGEQGEAVAIEDGVREIGAQFWAKPERSEAFSQRDQQSLLIK